MKSEGGMEGRGRCTQIMDTHCLIRPTLSLQSLLILLLLGYSGRQHAWMHSYTYIHMDKTEEEIKHKSIIEAIDIQ